MELLTCYNFQLFSIFFKKSILDGRQGSETTPGYQSKTFPRQLFVRQFNIIIYFTVWEEISKFTKKVV